jgi:RHS repeat-associated protein
VAEVDETGNVTKSYGYRPGSTWTTDPFFMKIGANYYFYQNDHLGTPQKLTAINGAVVWSAKYSAFGKAEVDHSSTITNNLRYPGQYFDQETGLHYNYNRYYDSETGRYLRSDPIGLNGGLNRYIYGNGNPLRYIDYEGLACAQSSEWEPITVWTNSVPKGRLVSRTTKTKWKLVKVWDIVPFAYGKESGSLNCACRWEPVGCTEKAHYKVLKPHKATFDCDDGECRVWKETQYKDIEIDVYVEQDDVPCYLPSFKITYGTPSGQGCSCEEDIHKLQ